MTAEPEIIMTHWVVYKNPLDYPGQYVARKHRIVRGASGPIAEKEPVIVTDDYDAARAVIPQMLYRLERVPGDDPVIMEVWI